MMFDTLIAADRRKGFADFRFDGFRFILQKRGRGQPVLPCQALIMTTPVSPLWFISVQFFSYSPRINAFGFCAGFRG